MSCEEFRGRIGAARDGELDEAARLQLEAHLAECSECRGAVGGQDHLDALLRRSLKPMRRRADELAERIARNLEAAVPQPASPRSMWAWLVAALVAGFLIALLLFQPWRPRVMPAGPVAADGVPQESPVETAASEATPVAQVTASTGPIDVRYPDQSQWVTVSDLSSFRCPSDTSVKTPSGTVCELETTSGSLVRMRDDTEVKVHTADEVELNTGHLWCNVPESRRLLVSTGPSRDPVSAEAFGPAGISMQCKPPDSPTVTSSSGRVDVACGPERTSLNTGGSVQFVRGALVPSDPPDTPLLSDAWMYPLLTRKGYRDPELRDRVDALLARIGDMKMSLLYEQQVRGLGEYAALPLLKYIQAGPSDETRRESAARILADLAPVWLVPDLMGLLDDENPRIRFQADRALVRLTGRESGMSAENWASDRSVRVAATGAWRDWWERNSGQFTSRPASEVVPDAEEPLLKVRNQ
jgi:Putative zinc-finger